MGLLFFSWFWDAGNRRARDSPPVGGRKVPHRGTERSARAFCRSKKDSQPTHHSTRSTRSWCFTPVLCASRMHCLRLRGSPIRPRAHGRGVRLEESEVEVL